MDNKLKKKLFLEKVKEMARDKRKKLLDSLPEKCYFCGSKRKIEIHHIDADKKNNNIDNLMVLCISCHRKIHHKIYKRIYNQEVRDIIWQKEQKQK